MFLFLHLENQKEKISPTDELKSFVPRIESGPKILQSLLKREITISLTYYHVE